MKRLVIILVLLYVATGLNSCGKSPSCKGEDLNKGIIEKYYRIHDFPMCVEAYVSENGTIVIRSEQELADIVDSNCINLPDAGYSEEPPDIDFGQYSLLGFWVTGGGCEIRFIREVNSDNEGKKYTYKINVSECGGCDMLRYDANLVLVQKIPDDWTVQFIRE